MFCLHSRQGNKRLDSFNVLYSSGGDGFLIIDVHKMVTACHSCHWDLQL